MIHVMDQNLTFFDTDDEPLSIWPWVVGLVALFGVVFLTAKSSNAIQDSISTNVRQTLSAQNIAGIDVAVDGRDVSLSGTIDVSLNKRQLIASVADVNGVRTVNDNISVFDPKIEAEKRAQAFQSQLSGIRLDALAFEPNSASLTSDSRPALDALIQLLLRYPNQQVRVAGHTDNTGRPAVNLRISRERAATVASYMTSRGVAKEQVIARGFGASSPIADNSTEAGRARNRRIEISHIK